MARRKPAEVEVLPPEDEQSKPRGRKKLVDAEHTIKYSAPVPVEVEDDPEELVDLLEFDHDKPRRKPQKNERDELRKRLTTNGVTPNSQLKLSIERYVHTESMDSGTQAEKAYCSKYACNESHITGEDYLDVARQYGPGRYWFTLRLNNKIVTQWEKRLDTAPTVAGMNGVMNSDPNTPPVIYQNANPQAPPLTFNDYLKQMVQTKKLMDEISGTVPQTQPMSDEMQFAAVLLKDPVHAKKIVKNLIGGDGGEQSLMGTIIENAPAIIQSLTEGIRTIIGDITNARGNNGQATMVNQTVQTSGNGQTTGMAGLATVPIQARPEASTQTPSSTPEEQILNHLFSFVIEQCAQNTAPELVAAGIDRFMDEQVQSDYPLYFDKVWAQLEAFAAMDVETVLTYVKTLPNGAAVASLPHAREWTAKLQELLKPGEDESE